MLFNKKKKPFHRFFYQIICKITSLCYKTGGESGIRTHGTCESTHTFQACALNHSAISPPIYIIHLLKKIVKARPDFIMTNIGGGIQEILGLYLKKKLKFKITIICTGGAISFFTGDQAPINSLIDKLYLGWFIRLIYNPLTFSKRYLVALKLIAMVIFNKVVPKK